MTPEEKQRVAWTKFRNGLKLDGAERAVILRSVADLQQRVRKAEQARWNAEHYLELCVRQARYAILMGRDEGQDL